MLVKTGVYRTTGRSGEAGRTVVISESSSAPGGKTLETLKALINSRRLVNAFSVGSSGCFIPALSLAPTTGLKVANAFGVQFRTTTEARISIAGDGIHATRAIVCEGPDVFRPSL